jgi:hypothetical protein
MYDQFEKVKSLRNFIDENTVRPKQNPLDRQVLDDDSNWNASRFWAEAMFKATPIQYKITTEMFVDFKVGYETSNNVTISGEELFEKFLLRKVLDFIEIPEAILSAIYFFNEISHLKNEISFICYLYPFISNDRHNVERSFLEDKIKVYNQTANEPVNIESILSPAGLNLQTKGTKVDVPFVDTHYKPFLIAWKDFSFLSSLAQQFTKEIDGFKIKNAIFEKLHYDYSQVYNSIPPIQALIKQRSITLDGDKYSINFYTIEPRYWGSLSEKIAGNFWMFLVNDNNFISDKDRVKHFISQISYWSGSPDFLVNVTENSRKRFMDTALQLILEEEDIHDIGSEMLKVVIDSTSHNGLFFLKPGQIKFKNYALNNSDCFELLESLGRWSKDSHITELYDQRTRYEIIFLINLIVKNDSEVDNYKMVLELLNESLDRPMILWYVSRSIVEYRRAIAPTLLLEEKFVSLAFKIIDEFNFSHHNNAECIVNLWEKSIEIALITILNIVSGSDLPATRIYQIFRQLNSRKYESDLNGGSKIEGINWQKVNKEKEKKVLLSIENALLKNQKLNALNSEYFLPVIFNNLIVKFTQRNQKLSFYNGRILKFPLLKWDGISWLIKCSFYWKYKTQFNTILPSIDELVNDFYFEYKDILGIKNIDTTTLLSDEQKGIPIWGEKIDRLKNIEWIYPVYYLYLEGKLNNFISQEFSFIKSDNVYNELNQLALSKLRTHFGVLLEVFRVIVSLKIPFGFEKTKLNEIREKIESQILDYLTNHSTDIPKKGKVDLLNYRIEENSSGEALLPQIANSINWFMNKGAIIDSLSRTNNIIKILTIAEFITSEGIKEDLVSKIEKVDLKSFLEGSWYIPEIQTSLIKITQYPRLMNQITEIVDFWEQNISKKGKEFQVLLYRTKLLIAYYHHDENELNGIKEPDKENFVSSREISHNNYREFFRALLTLKLNPSRAHKIFNDLVKQYSTFPVFAMNRMVAKMYMAKDSDDTTIYSEALEEWELYQTENPDIDLSVLGEMHITNKFDILFKLGRYEQLDEEFLKLDFPKKMIQSIVETMINRFIMENKTIDASILLDIAEDYHKYSGQIEFLKDLRNKLSGIDNTEELGIYYRRIYESQPSKLIRIFPPKLNGKVELIEFITKEFALASNKMLDRINSLSSIRTENKYNDLVALALEARLGLWGWSVNPQIRKAFSATGKDLGELDFDIQDSNNQSIVTCEAFILRDRVRVKSHLEKLIASYTSNRKGFIVLIYCLEPQTKFETEWKNYSEQIVPNLSFPTGFEITDANVTDITKEFDYERSAIRIGKSIHGRDTPVFHILINIHYNIITPLN